MHPSGHATLITLATVFLTGCNALESLTVCNVDTDCGERLTCTRDGFCARPDPVRLGVSMPLTGTLAAFGAGIVTGIELGVEVVNRHGGVLGRDLAVEVRDDTGSNEGAVGQVNALVASGVAVIVGPLTSGQCLATAPSTLDANVLQISPSAGTPDLNRVHHGDDPRDRLFFRTISTMRTGSGSALALKMRCDMGCERPMVVHSADATGAAFADAIERAMTDLGAPLVASNGELPSMAVVDDLYAPSLDALFAASPDCVVVSSTPRSAATFIALAEDRAARRSGALPATLRWLGTSPTRSPDLVESLRGRPRYFPMVGADVDTSPPTSEFAAFERLYRDRFGAAPPQYASNGFDAVVLFALAVTRGGSLETRAIRDAIWTVTGTTVDHVVFGPGDLAGAKARLERGGEIHYSGASSKMLFDEFGTVTMPSFAWALGALDGADPAAAFVETADYYDEETIDLLLRDPAAAAASCGR